MKDGRSFPIVWFDALVFSTEEMGEVAASMTPSRFGIEDRVIIVRVGA